MVMPQGTEPHGWEPDSNAIKNLENADMLIYNGAGLESWTDKVIGSLSNKDLKLLKLQKVLTLLSQLIAMTMKTKIMTMTMTTKQKKTITTITIMKLKKIIITIMKLQKTTTIMKIMTTKDITMDQWIHMYGFLQRMQK